MVLEITQFSQGIGLVMIGWVAGTIIKYVFKTFESI